MDLPTFLNQFPEFGDANTQSPALVPAMLAAALNELDPTVWGDQVDQGQAYLAAHLLATSPYGQAAKMFNSKDGTSTYWWNFQRLKRNVSVPYSINTVGNGLDGSFVPLYGAGFIYPCD